MRVEPTAFCRAPGRDQMAVVIIERGELIAQLLRRAPICLQDNLPEPLVACSRLVMSDADGSASRIHLGRLHVDQRAR